MRRGWWRGCCFSSECAAAEGSRSKEIFWVISQPVVEAIRTCVSNVLLRHSKENISDSGGRLVCVVPVVLATTSDLLGLVGQIFHRFLSCDSRSDAKTVGGGFSSGYLRSILSGEWSRPKTFQMSDCLIPRCSSRGKPSNSSPYARANPA